MPKNLPDHWCTLLYTQTSFPKMVKLWLASACFFAPSREGTQLLPSTAAATSCQFSTQKHEGADSVPWPLLTHLGNGQVIYTGPLHPPWILPPSLHIYQPATQNPKQNTHLLLPHVQKYHASEMGRVRSTSWFPAGVDLILKSFVPK